jgi:hypothetical protein
VCGLRHLVQLARISCGYMGWQSQFGADAGRERQLGVFEPMLQVRKRFLFVDGQSAAAQSTPVAMKKAGLIFT